MRSFRKVNPVFPCLSMALSPISGDNDKLHVSPRFGKLRSPRPAFEWFVLFSSVLQYHLLRPRDLRRRRLPSVQYGGLSLRHLVANPQPSNPDTVHAHTPRTTVNTAGAITTDRQALNPRWCFWRIPQPRSSTLRVGRRKRKAGLPKSMQMDEARETCSRRRPDTATTAQQEKIARQRR
jgi:hypothetical protein